MPRLIELGDGRWRSIVELGRDPAGRRHRDSKTERLSKREAERWHARRVAEAQDRLPGAGTFGLLLDEWLAAAELSPSTRRGYEGYIERHIRPAFGTVLLRRLTTKRLDEHYRALTGAGMQPASVRQVHAIIRRALNQAVRWGLIEKNVALLATIPRLYRDKVRAPASATVRQLIDAAVYDDELYASAWLAAGTGARRGEIVALRWSDVDIEAGVIRVARALAVAGPGRLVEKDTKTHAERLVDIDARLVSILADHRRRMEKRAADTGTVLARDGFVVSRSFDCSSPFDPGTLSSLWSRHVRGHGATLRFHDLRHWSVTVGLAAGVELPVVAEQHGHRDGNVTLAVYGHPVDGRGRQLAEARRRALDG